MFIIVIISKKRDKNGYKITLRFAFLACVLKRDKDVTSRIDGSKVFQSLKIE